MKLITYNNSTFKETQYYNALLQSTKEEFDILSSIFHFKVNNYVTESLIDWKNVPDDPMFKLVFPRKEMLSTTDYEILKVLFKQGLKEEDLRLFVQQVKKKMYPEVKSAPTCIPEINGQALRGMYRNFDTIISLFPEPMLKTCHAYCSYCFRWLMFNNNVVQQNSSYKAPLAPVVYLNKHPEIKDVLFTGADPLILNATTLKKYIDPLLEIESIEVIRISSKALSWWPYRFTSDKDAKALLQLFEHIQNKGKHFNFCAHVTHVQELENKAVEEAIKQIRNTGAIIRCQGPLIKGVNDTSKDWSQLWSRQVELGMIPYYMFIEAGHNPENCFRVPLAKALEIFQNAQKQTTSLARTVRGPVFMNDLHRVLLDGTTTINGEKYFVLKNLQSPPGYNADGNIKLLPYDEQINSAGDLLTLFQE